MVIREPSANNATCAHAQGSDQTRWIQKVTLSSKAIKLYFAVLLIFLSKLSLQTHLSVNPKHCLPHFYVKALKKSTEVFKTCYQYIFAVLLMIVIKYYRKHISVLIVNNIFSYTLMWKVQIINTFKYLALKGCGMGPWLVLASTCFKGNVVATCKVGSFLCSLDNLLHKNVIFLFFGNQITKWRSFEKRAIFDLLFTFFSHQGKVTKIPSAHISLTYTDVFSL